MEAEHVIPGAACDCEVRVYALDLAGGRLHDLVDGVRHAHWQRVSRATARTCINKSGTASSCRRGAGAG